MVKTIGRAEGNDMKIEKNDISDFHVRITQLDNGSFLVEDRGTFKGIDSTNGTFINGYRVKKANVTVNDEIRLSENTVIDLNKLFNLQKPKIVTPKADPKDFTKEFLLLKKVYEDYKVTRKTVKQNHQRKASFIRAGIMLSPLAVYYLLQAMQIGLKENVYLPLSVSGSTIAMLVTGSMSPADALEELDEEFRVKYVCPKCRLQLGNISWKAYLNQGKCNRCDAIYSKDTNN